MALNIKDGNNVARTLKTTIDGTDHVAHHIIDSVDSTVSVTSSAANPVFVTGTIAVSASAANPVFVTGSVRITQPVDVEITVSDNISVTSSLAAPLYVSSSANSPLLVTGTVNINNYPAITTVTSSNNNPLLATGTMHIDNSVLFVSSSNNSPLLVTGTITAQGVNLAVADGLRVTSSVADPLWVSASFANPIAVTGAFSTTVTDGLRVTSSVVNPLWVTGTVNFNNGPVVVTSSANSPILALITSSADNPIWFTGSILPAVTATINISATASVGATVTASIYGSPAVSVSKNKYRVGDTIFYNASTSGTIGLAALSTARKGLIVHNSSNSKLYIVLGSGTLNGFSDVQDLQDEPNSYSFILYPSGTYIADLSLVNLFHGGWFVSSSNVDGASVFVTATE